MFLFTCKAGKPWMPERLMQVIAREQANGTVDFSHIIVTPPWYDGTHLTEDEKSAQLGSQEFQAWLHDRLKQVLSERLSTRPERMPTVLLTSGVKEALERVWALPLLHLASPVALALCCRCSRTDGVFATAFSPFHNTSSPTLAARLFTEYTPPHRAVHRSSHKLAFRGTTAP